MIQITKIVYNFKNATWLHGVWTLYLKKLHSQLNNHFKVSSRKFVFITWTMLTNLSIGPPCYLIFHFLFYFLFCILWFCKITGLASAIVNVWHTGIIFCLLYRFIFRLRIMWYKVSMVLRIRYGMGHVDLRMQVWRVPPWSSLNTVLPASLTGALSDGTNQADRRTQALQQRK